MTDDQYFELPDYEEVNVDATGYYPHVIRDDQLRITTAWGSILRPIRGTHVVARTRKIMGKDYGLVTGDDVGHIIPNCIGGSGIHIDNLFSQSRAVNRRRAAFERQLSNLLQDPTFSIRFFVAFFYAGNNLRAHEFVLIIQVFQNGIHDSLYAEVVPN